MGAPVPLEITGTRGVELQVKSPAQIGRRLLSAVKPFDQHQANTNPLIRSEVLNKEASHFSENTPSSEADQKAALMRMTLKASAEIAKPHYTEGSVSEGVNNLEELAASLKDAARETQVFAKDSTTREQFLAQARQLYKDTMGKDGNDTAVVALMTLQVNDAYDRLAHLANADRGTDGSSLPPESLGINFSVEQEGEGAKSSTKEAVAESARLEVIEGIENAGGNPIIQLEQIAASTPEAAKQRLDESLQKIQLPPNDADVKTKTKARRELHNVYKEFVKSTDRELVKKIAQDRAEAGDEGLIHYLNRFEKAESEALKRGFTESTLKEYTTLSRLPPNERARRIQEREHRKAEKEKKRREDDQAENLKELPKELAVANQSREASPTVPSEVSSEPPTATPERAGLPTQSSIPELFTSTSATVTPPNTPSVPREQALGSDNRSIADGQNDLFHASVGEDQNTQQEQRSQSSDFTEDPKASDNTSQTRGKEPITINVGDVRKTTTYRDLERDLKKAAHEADAVNESSEQITKRKAKAQSDVFKQFIAERHEDPHRMSQVKEIAKSRAEDGDPRLQNLVNLYEKEKARANAGDSRGSSTERGSDSRAESQGRHQAGTINGSGASSSSRTVSSPATPTAPNSSPPKNGSTVPATPSQPGAAPSSGKSTTAAQATAASTTPGTPSSSTPAQAATPASSPQTSTPPTTTQATVKLSPEQEAAYKQLADIVKGFYEQGVSDNVSEKLDKQLQKLLGQLNQLPESQKQVLEGVLSLLAGSERIEVEKEFMQKPPDSNTNLNRSLGNLVKVLQQPGATQVLPLTAEVTAKEIKDFCQTHKLDKKDIEDMSESLLRIGKELSDTDGKLLKILLKLLGVVVVSGTVSMVKKSAPPMAA